MSGIKNGRRGGEGDGTSGARWRRTVEEGWGGGDGKNPRRERWREEREAALKMGSVGLGGGLGANGFFGGEKGFASEGEGF
ncbi:hypothetical protein NL676_027023 [Syzygium grande]|nr:hypothetical protein NL676_027023 [Syzygium grande]